MCHKISTTIHVYNIYRAIFDYQSRVKLNFRFTVNSASESTELWHYINLSIIIIIHVYNMHH